MNKNSPNIWKFSQNWSQNIKAQIEGPKHQHTTAFDVKITTTNHFFKTAYFAKIVKQMPNKK